MITIEDFKERGKALWKSQQTMAATRYWKTGRRKGQVRVPAQVIHFKEVDLLRWLWKTVNLNAVPCHYCHTPVDILSLTLDHAMPRQAGGTFEIPNMRVCCKACNQRKGEMTEQGFIAVLEFRLTLSPYDQDVLLKRLTAAHHGAQQRFNRPKAQKKQSEPEVFF